MNNTKIGSMTLGLATLALAAAGVVGPGRLTAAPASADKQQAESVLRRFWQGMGQGGDAQKIKSTLAWPSIMQEITPFSAGSAFTYRTEADFDEEQKRVQPSPPKKKDSKYDLSGGFGAIKITGLQTTVINGNLASITYKCHIPETRITISRRSPAYTLSMVTVLKKHLPQKTWKISYTTIPQ